MPNVYHSAYVVSRGVFLPNGWSALGSQTQSAYVPGLLDLDLGCLGHSVSSLPLCNHTYLIASRRIPRVLQLGPL